MGKILIVADKGKSCVATSRGLELAAKLGYDAEVVAFVYAPLNQIEGGKDAQAAVRQQLLDKRREQLAERIDAFATGGQKVALKVVWMKIVHPWIVKRSSSQFAAVVKTSHSTGSLGYTSTDWHVLRECPVPVLMVAEKKWSRTRPVMAALDLGTRKRSKQQLNSRVLGAAKALAEALGVELKIMSAIDIPSVLADLDLVDPISYTKKHRQEMLPHLKALAKEHDIPEKAFITKRGPVAKVITSQAAKARAQIVVMGTVARQGLSAKLIGNTAETVLQDLHTDVLAIKPES
ncbi:universal stress protein [Congregibacter variabilis]|uniref:Universal stress protein n=1 Tax=Congregibacter variabilis TaxID=3081200 RepID=A0ABZ0I376_9GAMM|nr:universal stress protein [Congregibacter sp. IMCC43200]